MASAAGGFPEAPDQIPEIEEQAEQEVPDIPGPRSFVILQEDDTFDLGYTIGILDLDFTEGDKTCEVAAIAVIDGKLLVAVPEAVWSRTVQKRRLVAKALTKPTLVAVASCLEDARESAEDIVVQLRVWVGFLHPELEKNIEFLGAEDRGGRFSFWRAWWSSGCSLRSGIGRGCQRTLQLHDCGVQCRRSRSGPRCNSSARPSRGHDERHEVRVGCSAGKSHGRCYIAASNSSREESGRWKQCWWREESVVHFAASTHLLSRTPFRLGFRQLILPKLERS